MDATLLLFSSIIILCLLLHRHIEHLPIPSLLIFILLGMVFGENGIFQIKFDNYTLANDICSFALVFIMFYGGFGTNIEAARSIVTRAVLLSTVGVAVTAGITGVLIHYILGLSWMEALLFGSVIASTDAASVFTLLRTRNLNLKHNTASLLEVESGSNDPMSYMLTVVFVAAMLGSNVSVPVLLAKQVAIGLLCGVAIAYAAAAILRRVNFSIAQGGTLFVFAVAVLSYALPNFFEGNGYLSAYLAGILLGKMHFPGKRDLTRFFDAITHLAQVMVFFLLGLLVTPADLPEALVPALIVMAVLTFIARPVSIFAILTPFGAGAPQIGLVSWAGLRGVASIVFSIYAVLAAVPLTYNIFNLVFCIVLLSMAFQGSLLPKMSAVLDMIDDNADVRKTFNYYQDESNINFSKIYIKEQHAWANKRVRDIVFPPETLVVLLIRDRKNFIAPDGSTEILPNDILIFASETFENRVNLSLREVLVTSDHPLCGHRLMDAKQNIREGGLVVLVQRGGENIIPSGLTEIMENDMLVLAEYEE